MPNKCNASDLSQVCYWSKPISTQYDQPPQRSPIAKYTCANYCLLIQIVQQIEVDVKRIPEQCNKLSQFTNDKKLVNSTPNFSRWLLVHGAAI